MNKVCIIGRLTKDPEIKYSSNDLAIATFTLAVNRLAKKGEDKKTDFPRCIAFGSTAEVLQSYAHKGKQVAIEGRIQTGSYKKDDGSTVYTTDVIVDRLTLLGGSKKEDSDQTDDYVPDGFQQLDEDVPF